MKVLTGMAREIPLAWLFQVLGWRVMFAFFCVSEWSVAKMVPN